MSLSEKKNNEAPSGEPRTFQKVKARGEVERARTWKRNCSAGGRTSYYPLFSSGTQTRGGTFSRWVAHAWIQSGIQARQGHGVGGCQVPQNSVKIPCTIFFLNVTIRCCIRWQEAKICFRTHSPRTRAAVSCFGANYFKHRLFDTVSSFGPEKKKTVFISLSNTEFCVLLFLLPII